MNEQNLTVPALAMLTLDASAKALDLINEPVLQITSRLFQVLPAAPLERPRRNGGTVSSLAGRFEKRPRVTSIKQPEPLLTLRVGAEARLYLSSHQDPALDLLIIDTSSNKPLVCLFLPAGAVNKTFCDAIQPFGFADIDPRTVSRGRERYSLRRLKRFLLSFEWFLDSTQRPLHLHCRSTPPSWQESGAEGIFRRAAPATAIDEGASELLEQKKQDRTQVARLQAVVQDLSATALPPVTYAEPRPGGWRTRGTVRGPIQRDDRRNVSGASSEDWQGEGSIAARLLQGGMRAWPDLRSLFRPSNPQSTSKER